MTYQLHPQSTDSRAYRYLTIDEKGQHVFHPFALERVEYLYARDKHGVVWVNDWNYEWRSTGIKY